MNDRLILFTLPGLDHLALAAGIRAGRLPRLAALVRAGTSGPLRSPLPESAPGWAMLATGRHPDVHGVLDDAEVWAGGVRSASRAAWLAEPLWQRLDRAGIATAGIGWPATAPGASWGGTHIDDRVAAISARRWDDWPLPLDVAPPHWREAVRAARVHVDDVTREMVAPFFPTLVAAGVRGDTAALPIAKAMAKLSTVQALAGELIGGADWHLLAIHNDWLHGAAAALRVAPHALPDAAWLLLDQSLGALIDSAPGAAVAVAALGSAGRPGVAIFCGASVASGAALPAATALDFAPTVYAHFGLGDPGLEGRPLLPATAPLRPLPPEQPAPAPAAPDAADLARVATFGHRPLPRPSHWQAMALTYRASLVLDRDPGAARVLAETALEAAPDALGALAILAIVHATQGDAEGLARIADRLEAAAPEHLWAALMRGASHALRGEAEAARPYLDRVEREGGNDEALRVGQAWLTLGRHADAARLFRRVLDTQPERVPALLGLADALPHQPIAAEQLIRQALEADPVNAQARTALSALLRRLGRHVEAQRLALA